MARVHHVAALCVAVVAIGCGGRSAGNIDGGLSGSDADLDGHAGNIDGARSRGDAGRDASTTLPVPYAGMCTRYSLTCTTTQDPPSLIGSYSGSGTTIDTSSATWTVGSTSSFVATISSQTGSTFTGTFQLGGISLAVSGNINGTASGDFTLYGTGSTTINGCTMTAAVVIVGTASSGTVTGDLALLVLSTSGSGCTSWDGGPSFPSVNTGAEFSFTATSVTNLDAGLDGG
jgi:hypothetical protein